MGRSDVQISSIIFHININMELENLLRANGSLEAGSAAAVVVVVVAAHDGVNGVVDTEEVAASIHFCLRPSAKNQGIT